MSVSCYFAAILMSRVIAMRILAAPYWGSCAMAPRMILIYYITNQLSRAQGVDNVLSYHAKMNSEERVGNLNAFRAHENREVLVCTDLASRGLDIPDVSLVIQLQFAANVVAHLHRVGRCGRLTSEGRSGGRAVVFWGEQERDLVEAVRQADVIASELMGVAEDEEGGTVEAAFSRKRGFRKKRKKEARGNHN